MSGYDHELAKAGWYGWNSLEGESAPENASIALADIGKKITNLLAHQSVLADRELRLELTRIESVIGSIESMFSADDDSEYKAIIVRRKPGRPQQSTARTIQGLRLAERITELVSEGVKQEAAIEEARSKSGFSRSELFEWLNAYRAGLRPGKGVIYPD